MTAPPTRHAARRRRDGWERARSAMATALLSVLALFALLTVVVPMALGAQTYTVLTGSMRPGMPPGSLVAVRETPIDDIRVGDVVTYQLRPGEPDVVTHRVVGTVQDNDGDTLLTTRGDANDVADAEPVRAVQVRGTVVYAVPLLGYPGALVTGSTRSALVALAGLVVVGWGVGALAVDLVRGRRRRRVVTLSAVLLAVLVAPTLGWSSPDRAHADVLEPGPDGALLVSDDGTTWHDDGAVSLFGDLGRLAPGEPVPDTLWVRNGSTDPARITMSFTWDPQSPDGSDRALASSLAVQAGGELVTEGRTWDGPVLAPGESRRVDLALLLSPRSGNATQHSAAVVHPTIALTQVLPADEPGAGTTAPASDAATPLAGTGGILGAVAIWVGAGSMLAGVGLLLATRTRRSRM